MVYYILLDIHPIPWESSFHGYLICIAYIIFRLMTTPQGQAGPMEIRDFPLLALRIDYPLIA
jgi:hypothetical protein